MKVWELATEVNYFVPDEQGIGQRTEGPYRALYTTKEGCIKARKRFMDIVKGACVDWKQINEYEYIGKGENCKTYKATIYPRTVYDV